MDANSLVSSDPVPVTLSAQRSNPPPAFPCSETRAGPPPVGPVRCHCNLLHMLRKFLVNLCNFLYLLLRSLASLLSCNPLLEA